MKTFGAFLLALLLPVIAMADPASSAPAPEITAWPVLVSALFALGAFVLKKRAAEDHFFQTFWGQAVLGVGVSLFSGCAEAIRAHGLSKNTLILAAAGALMTWMLTANSAPKGAALLPFLLMLGGCDEAYMDSYKVPLFFVDLTAGVLILRWLGGFSWRRCSQIAGIACLPYALALLSMTMAVPGCAGGFNIARTTVSSIDTVIGAATRIGAEAIKQCADDSIALAQAQKFDEADAKLSTCNKTRDDLEKALRLCVDATGLAARSIDIAEAAGKKNYVGILGPALEAAAALFKAFGDAGLKLPAIPGIS